MKSTRQYIIFLCSDDGPINFHNKCSNLYFVCKQFLSIFDFIIHISRNISELLFSLLVLQLLFISIVLFTLEMHFNLKRHPRRFKALKYFVSTRLLFLKTMRIFQAMTFNALLHLLHVWWAYILMLWLFKSQPFKWMDIKLF